MIKSLSDNAIIGKLAVIPLEHKAKTGLAEQSLQKSIFLPANASF
jgi:hypothetical protein